MNVMVLLLFVGIVLATSALVFFLWNVQSGAFEHAERLALLPLRTEPKCPGTEREIRDVGAAKGPQASHEGLR